ncbi:hypothetical protein OKW33_006195 [Paraburkholderia atlantica]|uniref:Uncharacterized protein n=1 Tax=Paraburkholderia atlantica TaxID=2654982 RepID=A0A6I1Q2A8_PARAM|nr:hypothetical protein [Paraburkholderia atlantica]MBB5428952.1 hypothetical protein [Paraburkholderia atlantica]MPW08428.1 hypothetical protein [Paraburkholderia atlantica]NUY35664.1 hypothetical protein [Paraburkholderia atlantica]
MPNLLLMPKPTSAASCDDTTKICFRYRGGRRHARLYDVLMTLGDPGGACRIEIREALPCGVDTLPLTPGRLNAARLMRALDLIGLVERITARDDARSEPGRLLCDAHLQLPWHPAAAKLRVNAPALPVRGPRRNTTLGPVRGRCTRMMASSLQNSPSGELQAHALAHYPLRGMGRGARLQRRERIG